MGRYAIGGSIFSSTGHPDPGSLEGLVLSRADMQRARLRKTGERGTDVIISLDSSEHLHDGDILEGDGPQIVVRQAPEKVASTALPASVEAAALLGHIIGNRHRPISVKDGRLIFPIQADSEIETFERLLASVSGTRLSVDEVVFESLEGADVHEH